MLAITAPLTTGTAIFSFIVFIIGFQALFSGATEIYYGFRLRRLSIVLLGALSVLLGGALLLNPLIGVAALAVVLGIFALAGGILTIIVVLQQARTSQPHPAR